MDAIDKEFIQALSQASSDAMTLVLETAAKGYLAQGIGDLIIAIVFLVVPFLVSRYFRNLAKIQDHDANQATFMAISYGVWLFFPIFLLQLQIAIPKIFAPEAQLILELAK